MTMADWVGGYGAILATVLAAIQYRQWQLSHEKLSIDVYDECSAPPSHVHVTITNLSNSNLYVKFLGIGFCYRPWHKPWKIVHDELAGMLRCENERNTKKGVEGNIDPGNFIEAYADESVFRRLDDIPTLRKGFRWRWMIQVDHSLPNFTSSRIFDWSVGKSMPSNSAK